MLDSIKEHWQRDRGSYMQMSSYVSLTILNDLRKRDKIRGLPSKEFNEFNKFNNTRALMLDSIDHMSLKLSKSHIFGVTTSIFCHLLHNVILDAKLRTTVLNQ